MKTILKLAQYALWSAFAFVCGVSANAAIWDKNEFVKYSANNGDGVNVLIIGANGSVAKWAIGGFL